MKNLNLHCPINGTGYGITSLNILKGLKEHNIDVSLFPIGTNLEFNTEQDKILLTECLNRSNTFDYDAPCLKIWHQHDLALKIGNKDYYTFPFFEIDTILPKEQHHLNYSDHIFVASQWAKQILENNKITKPIHVAPLGVDTSIFTNPAKLRMDRDNYVFFHIGKWEHRKAQDFLVQVFDNAFDKDDKVELWLLPYNPFLSEEENQYWINLVSQCKLTDKIKLFNRLPSQMHLAEFIYYGDCGVFLSRAEGWNNEVIETMAMNKPVIVTNYSAHTEYCNDKNSYLVNIDSVEPAHDNKWFFGQGNWAKLGDHQMEQAVHYMKYVYNNRIDSNPEGLKTAKYYSWSRTTSIIDKTLSDNNSYANS